MIAVGIEPKIFVELRDGLFALLHVLRDCAEQKVPFRVARKRADSVFGAKVGSPKIPLVAVETCNINVLCHSVLWALRMKLTRQLASRRSLRRRNVRRIRTAAGTGRRFGIRVARVRKCFLRRGGARLSAGIGRLFLVRGFRNRLRLSRIGKALRGTGIGRSTLTGCGRIARARF